MFLRYRCVSISSILTSISSLISYLDIERHFWTFDIESISSQYRNIQISYVWHTISNIAKVPDVPYHIDSTKLKQSSFWESKWNQWNQGCGMLLCSFVHELQQQMFAHMILWSCRIMHLIFLAASNLFAACLPEKRVWRLHSVSSCWEAAYQFGNSNHWFCLILHHWRTDQCTQKAFRPPSYEYRRSSFSA